MARQAERGFRYSSLVQARDRIRELLEEHDLPLHNSSALAREVQERTKIRLSRTTFDRFLFAEEPTDPSERTLRALFGAVDASHEVRIPIQRLLAIASGHLHPWSKRFRERLPEVLAKGELNRGRQSEDVTYTYFIDGDDEKDWCREDRLTRTPPEGIGIATVGPGQWGSMIWDICHTGKLELRAGGRNSRKPVAVSVDPYMFSREINQYRWLIDFDDESPGDTVDWGLWYRWPGLWRPLRSTGIDHGSVGKLDDTIRTITMRYLASDPIFDGFEIRRLTEFGSRPRKITTKDGKFGWQWTIERPPPRVEAEIIAPKILRAAERS